MNLKYLLVMGVVGLGAVSLARAAIIVGAGETLRSTDTVLDSWRTTVGEGVEAVVRYTPEVVLEGGTFVLDDAVPSEFRGTVSGVGALELRNTADVVFSGGEGLAEGATIYIGVPSGKGKVTLGGGNVFGGASQLHVSYALVWGPEDADIVFPSTLQLKVEDCALYARSGRSWMVEGPVLVAQSSALANYGTFVLTGECTFVNNDFLALYEGTSHDFSAMSVNGPGSLQLFTAGVLKLPASETAGDLRVNVGADGRGRLDLGGSDCMLGELQGESRAARIVNSGTGTATLTLARASTFKGEVDVGIDLVVPGGTTLRANGLTTGGVTAHDGMVTLLGDDATPCVRARYIRFVVDKIRTREAAPRAVNAWDVVAFSEIVLTGDGGAVHVPWPSGTTATQEFRYGSTTCGPELVIDGDVYGDSKICIQVQEAGFSVKIDMGRPVAFNGYKWWTSNDSPERDPMAWHLEISDDGENWTVADTVEAYETPSTPRTQMIYRDVAGGADVIDVVESSSPVLAGGETSMFSCGAYRWLDLDVSQVSNLVLNGTVLNWNASMEAWRGLLAGQGVVDLVGATSEKVEVPFACVMPGVSFANSGSTARTLSFGNAPARVSATGARHVRFRVTALRNNSPVKTGMVVALSEFALIRNGQTLAWPDGTTARQLEAFNEPTVCGADLLIDGLTSTKHCIQMLSDGFCVQFDMPAKTYFDGYRWWTADDAPQREPSAWTVEISDDGENWTMVDGVSDYFPTEDRQELAADRRFEEGASGASNAIADNLVLEVNGPFAVEGLSETVAGLAGAGVVSLVSGGELTLDVPENTAETMPSFGGTVMCDGTLVKTGAGSQRLSGRIDCARLVVREGTLDVRGAVFSRKVAVSLEGGRLYGRSGFVVMVR